MRHLILRALLAVLAACALPAAALAGATSPKLTIAAAEGTLLDGARSARIEGAFDFENALQTGYGMHIVIYQGTSFARYPVAGTAVVGTSGALADGVLTEGEVDAFLLEGASPGAQLRIVSLTPTECLLTLPAALGAGPAHAVLVADTNEGPVFSNVLDFTLP